MNTYAVVTKHFGIIPGKVVGYVKMSDNVDKIKVYNSDTSEGSKDWKWCAVSRNEAHLAKAFEMGSELRTFTDQNGYTCLCW